MQKNHPVPKLLKLAATALTLSLFAACGGGGGGTATTNPLPTGVPSVASAKDLVNASAADYRNNRWGLIEAATLQTYVESWATKNTVTSATLPPNGRPEHLADDARLIVLQLNAANRAISENFIPSNPARNVYVYQLDSFRFNEARDTGLISESVRYQASGATTDAWLAKYGIDLSRDFVVFASGENTAANGFFFMDLTRGTYWLNYWGADSRHVAILNGTLKQNYTGTLAASATVADTVSNGGFTVKNLRTDNTVLTLSLEDLLKVVDEQSASTAAIPGFSSQLIVDARPTAQFDRTAAGAFNATHPGQFITTAWDSAGAPELNADGSQKTYVAYEGHIKGAVSFPWAALLENDPTRGWIYKNKAALETIFTNAGYAPTDVALNKVIVSQCRTNFEVQINGFAARLILGYPTVYFDGSLVEYTSLVSNHPDTALNLLPTDPAYLYRTDTPERSQFFRLPAGGVAGDIPATGAGNFDDTGVAAYNGASGTGAQDRKVSVAKVNRAATTTKKALNEDKEYKRL